MSIKTFVQKPAITTALKAALALGALGYLVYLVEPGQIVAAAAGADLRLVAAAAALLPLNVLLEGAAWQRILKAASPHTGWRSVFGALFCGYALGFATPARAGEFVGRAFYLPRADRWQTSATVFAQRLLDMVVSVNAGLLALLYALTAGLIAPTPVWWGVALFGAGVGLSLTAVMLAPGWAARALTAALHYGLLLGARTLALLTRPFRGKKGSEKKGGRTVWWDGSAPRRRAAQFREVPSQLAFLRSLGRGRMAQALLLSLGRYLVFTSQFVLFVRAFAPGTAPFAAYLGVALVFFAKFLIPSVTLLDIGIREGAAVFFYGQLGVAEAAALNAAFFIFCTNLLLPAAAGLPFVLNMRVGRGGNARPSESTSLEEPPSATPLHR